MGERRKQYEDAYAAYEKQYTCVCQFCDALGNVMGDECARVAIDRAALGDLEALLIPLDGQSVQAGGEGDADVKAAASDGWDDEDARAFYTCFPNIHELLPPSYFIGPSYFSLSHI